MPAICFREKNFFDDTLHIIELANKIIEKYESEGFSLTLRQLYYQFVARDLIPNKQKEYNRLGRIINDARMAGMIDWYAIEDRTRNLRGNQHFDNPEAVIKAARDSYKIDMWEDQPYHVEVWIEKDALIGVISNICRKLDVDYFSCRGYVSQSEMFAAARRLRRKHLHEEKMIHVIHLGDHDPSGMDMTRDISERLNLLSKDPRNDYDYNYDFVNVKRIALNMDQVQRYEPPPNPAKTTDSRFEGYIKKYGRKSWELDALEPKVMENMIREAVEPLIDDSNWEADEERFKVDKKNLNKIHSRYDDIVEYLSGTNGQD